MQSEVFKLACDDPPKAPFKCSAQKVDLEAFDGEPSFYFFSHAKSGQVFAVALKSYKTKTIPKLQCAV